VSRVADRVEQGALRDLEDITTYIAVDNEMAAEQLRERI
jgi:plasmid stabilization system protein ParE